MVLKKLVDIKNFVRSLIYALKYFVISGMQLPYIHFKSLVLSQYYLYNNDYSKHHIFLKSVLHDYLIRHNPYNDDIVLSILNDNLSFANLDVVNELYSLNSAYIELLSQYLRLYSSFNNAAIVRHVLRKKIISNCNWIVGLLFKNRYMSACIENGDYSRVTPTIYSLNYIFSKRYRDIYKFLFSINVNREKKSISLVGPSKLSDLDIDQIKQSNIIAVTNYNHYLPFIEKTEICFLNHKKLSYLCSENNCNLISRFKTVYTKSKKDYVMLSSLCQSADIMPSANTRSIFFNDGGINSGPNGIQIAIHTLLLIHQYKIFLFGVTSYAKSLDYVKGYDDTIDALKIALSLREHDAIANYLFLKNLISTNLINISEEVTGLYRMSDIHYARVLDKRFPNVNFINHKYNSTPI